MTRAPLALTVAMVAVLLAAGCASQAPPDRTDVGDAHLDQPEPRPARPAPPIDIELPPAPEPRDESSSAWPPLISGLDIASDAFQALLRVAETDETAGSVNQRADLTTVVAVVLTRNPGIQSARARLRAVEAEHTELDALLRVRAQYRAFTDRLDPGVSARLPRTSGPDAYPLPGVEGLRSRLVDHAVAIARSNLQSVVRRVVRDARMVFARARFQQERVAILGDQLQLARSLLAVMKSRFETGNADLGSVLALEERVARLSDARDDAQRALQSDRANLRRVMSIDGDGPTTLEPVPDDLLAATPPAATDERLARHPDVRMLELMQERTVTMQELIETMARPDADLDLSELPSPLDDRPAFRERPAPMPPGPWYGLMEARRAELSHRAAALGAARTARIDQFRAAARSATEDLASARAERELQEQTLDGLARQAIDATTEAFRTGGVDVDRVLAALTQRLDATLGSAAARRDIAIAQAEADFLVPASG